MSGRSIIGEVATLATLAAAAVVATPFAFPLDAMATVARTPLVVQVHWFDVAAGVWAGLLVAAVMIGGALGAFRKIERALDRRAVTSTTESSTP